jgi:hypothetical protein
MDCVRLPSTCLPIREDSPIIPIQAILCYWCCNFIEDLFLGNLAITNEVKNEGFLILFGVHEHHVLGRH